MGTMGTKKEQGMHERAGGRGEGDQVRVRASAARNGEKEHAAQAANGVARGKEGGEGINAWWCCRQRGMGLGTKRQDKGSRSGSNLCTRHNTILASGPRYRVAGGPVGYKHAK